MARKIDPATLDLKEVVVDVKSVSKTVKGGRVRKFTALVVVGDENGHVGYGLGKAAERPEAVRKGIEDVKKNIIGFGTIDFGYTGSIRVKLYNMGWLPVRFKPGDKIIQLVINEICIPELELADELEDTERGDNGFGSTGR